MIAAGAASAGVRRRRGDRERVRRNLSESAREGQGPKSVSHAMIRELEQREGG